MFTYSQSSGLLTFDGQPKFTTSGYSGHGPGLNNPAMENVPDVGPIPATEYDIDGPIVHPGLAAPVFRLLPKVPGTTHGRAGFLMHGDNEAMNCTASEGCIILSHPARVMIDSLIEHTGDRTLVVTA